MKRIVNLGWANVCWMACMLLLCVGACKDDDAVKIPAGTADEELMDSLYLYAAEIYYWYESLPDYTTFAPREYYTSSDMLDNLDAELFGITEYAINPSTGKSYEYVSASSSSPKYSFIQEGSTSSSDQGSVSLTGVGDDFGLALTLVSSADLRVRYAISGGPAADAGLKRGDRILTVNGASVSTYSVSQLNSALEASTISLTYQRTGQASQSTTLTRTTYTVDPVFTQAVWTDQGENVGYLAFLMFSGDYEASLVSAFSTFADAGVTHLIIDLRYNGGGYVDIAEYLADLIAPSSLQGNDMYVEEFNDKMQRGKASILKYQTLYDSEGNAIAYNGRNATYADVDYSEDANTYSFDKEGSLETVTHLYVITSGNTASASELLINAFRPYMPVTLFGQTTYGKPVGFFGIQLGDYSVYMTNFRVINADGESDYYAGFDPDVTASDDYTHDFGDPEEGMLADVLDYIYTGGADDGRISESQARTSSQGTDVGSSLQPVFTERRHSLMP